MKGYWTNLDMFSVFQRPKVFFWSSPSPFPLNAESLQLWAVFKDGSFCWQPGLVGAQSGGAGLHLDQNESYFIWCQSTPQGWDLPSFPDVQAWKPGFGLGAGMSHDSSCNQLLLCCGEQTSHESICTSMSSASTPNSSGHVFPCKPGKGNICMKNPRSRVITVILSPAMLDQNQAMFSRAALQGVHDHFLV